MSAPQQVQYLIMPLQGEQNSRPPTALEDSTEAFESLMGAHTPYATRLELAAVEAGAVPRWGDKFFPIPTVAQGAEVLQYPEKFLGSGGGDGSLLGQARPSCPLKGPGDKQSQAAHRKTGGPS